MAEADPKFLRVVQHPQHRKLEAVISAANAALPHAARGDLLSSHAGIALINSLYDLLEVDALYDLAGDICHDLRVSREGQPLDRFGEVRS